MRTSVLAAAVALSLTLAGCSEAPEAAGDVAPTPSATPTPTTSATPSPTPTPASFTYSCSFDVGEHETEHGEFRSYDAVWDHAEATGHPATHCEATMTNGTMSETDLDALEVAYGDRAKTDSLGTLYGICAQTSGYGVDFVMNDGQAAELNGALTICPDRPNADQIRANIAAMEQESAEIADGSRFGEGTKIVGQDIQAGTYVIDVSGNSCYWERLDSAGNIIDNNAIMANTRVEVTIEPTDYSFNSFGCGQWVRQ